MTKRELSELKRAVKDTHSKKPKNKAQHKEDEDWLDWAVSKATKYGPQLLELLAGVL